MKGWYAQQQLLANLLFDPWGIASNGKGKGKGKAKGQGKASSDRKGKGKGGEKGKGKAHHDWEQMLCHCCGLDNHLKKNCWHTTKECANCGGVGHLAAMCNKPKKDKNEDTTDDKRRTKTRSRGGSAQHVLQQTKT